MDAHDPKNDNGSVHEDPNSSNPLFQTARKVLLASVGAMALAQDEIEDFVNRLIERGEIAETDGRKLMQEIKERRKANMGRAEDLFSSRMDSMIKRLNIPTKADIDSLSEKIAILSKKMDEIINQQGK
ncbi:MAG TPA: phasin family protein [Anaerolineales bacterium]|nr:phasin family protein [Anaerolineales bacterium]